MAVFTAIGTAIATAIGGALVSGTTLTLLGSLVAGTIAAGLAFGTAKLLGVFEPPAIPGIENVRGNGSKVQVAPSTDNKIGVAFGRNFMSGPIIDANISNKNQTMHYCIALSEFIVGANYTVNDIYWGDSKLVFAGGTGINNANVVSKIDPNGTTNVDWKDKIRLRVYAGSTSSLRQVFPAVSGQLGYNMMPHWNAQMTMQDLVFAMVEVDYDAENGLTGLGSLTFDMTNDVTNPGQVLLKYLNHPVWGGNVSNDSIDVNSITGSANTQMAGYCDELINYTSNANVTANIARHQINGYLSTFDSVMDNIDKICKNSSTYFTFDGKQGKFKAIPNRQISSSEKSSAFVLNDDNIISKISVTDTELYSLYNSAKVSFADSQRKDQTNTINVETPAGDRNTNEPDNELNYRAELVNNNIHAEFLANIDLNQSRKGMVVNLTADYSALQIDAGDIVKLTNTDFGFSDKLFKIMRNRENISAEGMISCELLLLEYDDSVYGEPSVTQSDYFNYDGFIQPTTKPVDIQPLRLAKKQYGNVAPKATSGSGNIDGVRVDVKKDFVNSEYEVAVIHDDYLFYGGDSFNPGDTVTVSGAELDGTDEVHDLVLTVGTVAHATAKISSFNAAVGNSFVHPGMKEPILAGELLANLAVGTQIMAQPSTNASMVASISYSNIAANIDVDLANVDSGEYAVDNRFTPIGSLANISTASFGVGVQGDVTFANGTVAYNYFDSRTRYVDQTDLPAVLSTANNFVVTDQMDSVTFRPVGFNTSDLTAGTGERGYEGMKVELLKLRRGDKF